MLKTIVKRILQSIPTLLIVVTFTFILTRMIPGNPALTMLGPQAPKESVEQLEEELGARLFNRSNHRIILTEDGMLLKRRAQELISLADKTKREFIREENQLAGEISIGCGELSSVSCL
mgnify:CR=1 FL=1